MTDQPTDDATLLHSWRELQAALRAFFARSVAGDDVDDLLQECFLRVSQGLSALQDQDRLGAWVFRIARNLVTDHRRRQRSSQGAESLEEDPAACPAEPDLNVQVGGWLASMIDQLPAKYAEVLRESELDEVSHREIAARFDLSISGVKSRVQRGRAMLRDKLLACCAFEFDPRGRIQDYRRNPTGKCDC